MLDFAVEVAPEWPDAVDVPVCWVGQWPGFVANALETGDLEAWFEGDDDVGLGDEFVGELRRGLV